MHVPFDDGEAGRYRIEVLSENSECGDGIVLTADRDGYRALAAVFLQMAEGSGAHVHLGYTHDTQPGPGWRLVLETGK